MTALTASQLADTHPMLPSGWRRSMSQIKARGGPWNCTASNCGGPSYVCYRCSKCGRNLCHTGSGGGRDTEGFR